MAVSSPLGLRPPDKRRHRPLVQVLVRRRGLRADLLQGLSVVVGVALGFWTPRLTAGPTVDSVSTADLLTGIAAGVLPFVGIVYSLLFLVVQFGSAHLTPRLNLFRDNPLVWRSFSYFVGLFVWSATASVVVRAQDRVSVIVPVAALVGVIAAFMLFRRLEIAAFASIQLAPTLRDISEHARPVIDALYWQTYEGEHDAPAPLPEVRTELRWKGPGGVLDQLNLPALMRAAAEVDGIIELSVTPGDTIREGRWWLGYAAGKATSTAQPSWGLSGSASSVLSIKTRASLFACLPTSRPGPCRRPSTTKPRRCKSSTPLTPFSRRCAPADLT